MKSILKFENDVDIIAIVKTRLNGMNGCCAVAKSLHMLDDGLDLMDKKEVEALKRMKKDLSEVEAKSTEFKEAFKKKAKDVLPGPARAKKKTSKTPTLRLPDGDISQPLANTLLPPGCTIWRDRIRGGWMAHPEGLPRCSFMWSDHGGELQALHGLLRYVWRCHLVASGWDTSQCPVEGLFEAAASIAGLPPGSKPGGSAGPA